MLSTQRVRVLPKFVCIAKHHILGLGVLGCQENSAILRRMQTVCEKISQITPYPKLPRSTLSPEEIHKDIAGKLQGLEEVGRWVVSFTAVHA